MILQKLLNDFQADKETRLPTLRLQLM